MSLRPCQVNAPEYGCGGNPGCTPVHFEERLAKQMAQQQQKSACKRSSTYTSRAPHLTLLLLPLFQFWGLRDACIALQPGSSLIVPFQKERSIRRFYRRERSCPRNSRNKYRQEMAVVSEAASSRPHGQIKRA